MTRMETTPIQIGTRIPQVGSVMIAVKIIPWQVIAWKDIIINNSYLENKIDLTEYGFKEIARNENWVEYYNGEYRVSIFDYQYLHGNKTASRIQSFVVNTKETTSMAHPLEKLEQWLKEKNITKK